MQSFKCSVPETYQLNQSVLSLHFSNYERKSSEQLKLQLNLLIDEIGAHFYSVQVPM